MMQARCGMEYQCCSTRRLQVQAVIGEVLHAHAEMQQQCFHISDAQIVMQGMTEECLQRVCMLLFHL